MTELEQNQHIQLLQFMALMQNCKTETEMQELKEQYYNIPRYSFLQNYIPEKNSVQSFSSYKTNLIYEMDKYRHDYKLIYGENVPAYRKESMPQNKADYTVLNLLDEISGCDDIETYRKLLAENNTFPKAKIEALSSDSIGIYFSGEKNINGLPSDMIRNSPENNFNARKQLVDAGYSLFDLPSADDVKENGIDWLHEVISHFKESLNPDFIDMENQMNQEPDFQENEYAEEFDNYIEEMYANDGMSSMVAEADYEAEQNPHPDYSENSSSENTSYGDEEYWKTQFLNDNAETFKALDDFLNDGIKPKNDEFIFSRVPEILKSANVSDNEIVIKTSVINKARNEHSLSADEIRKAVENIAIPVLIFESDRNSTENKKHSYLSLTDTFARNGKPVAFSMNLDSEYERNRSILEVNEIRSIHDRTLVAKNGTDLIQKWTADGLCRYVDDKKISEWQLAAGVQFPLAVLHSDSFIIQQKDGAVNEILSFLKFAEGQKEMEKEYQEWLAINSPDEESSRRIDSGEIFGDYEPDENPLEDKTAELSSWYDTVDWEDPIESAEAMHNGTDEQVDYVITRRTQEAENVNEAYIHSEEKNKNVVRAFDIWDEIKDLISEKSEYEAKKFAVLNYLYNKGADDAAGYDNSFEINMPLFEEFSRTDGRIQQILEKYKDYKIDFDDQALAVKIAGTSNNNLNKAKQDFTDFVERKRIMREADVFHGQELDAATSENNLEIEQDVSQKNPNYSENILTDNLKNTLSVEKEESKISESAIETESTAQEEPQKIEKAAEGSNYSNSRPQSLQELHKFFIENSYVPGTPVPTIAIRNGQTGHSAFIEGYTFARFEDIGRSNPAFFKEENGKQIRIKPDGQTVVLTKPVYKEAVNEITGKKELVPDEEKRLFIRISRDLYEQAISNSQIIAKRSPSTEQEKQKMYDDYLEAANLDEKRQRADTADNFWHNYQAGVMTLANNKQEAMAFAKRLVNEMIPAEREKFAAMVRKYEKLKGPNGKHLSYDQRILERYEDITKGLKITNNSIWRDHVGKEYDTLDAIKQNTEVFDKEGQPLDKTCRMKIGDTIKISVTADSALSNKKIKLPPQEYRLVAHSKDSNSVALISADGKQKIIKNREDFIKEVQKVEKRQIKKQQRQDKYESISM